MRACGPKIPRVAGCPRILGGPSFSPEYQAVGGVKPQASEPSQANPHLPRSCLKGKVLVALSDPTAGLSSHNRVFWTCLRSLPHSTICLEGISTYFKALQIKQPPCLPYLPSNCTQPGKQARQLAWPAGLQPVQLTSFYSAFRERNVRAKGPV